MKNFYIVAKTKIATDALIKMGKVNTSIYDDDCVDFNSPPDINNNERLHGAMYWIITSKNWIPGLIPKEHFIKSTHPYSIWAPKWWWDIKEVS